MKGRILNKETRLDINWSEFFTRYRPVAIRFTVGLVHSTHLAEDLFQEAARSVYERIQNGAKTFETQAHLRNYFFRSLRNLAVSALRDAGRKKTSALDGAQQIESSGVQPFEVASRNERSLAQARRDRMLNEAVSALKPREQEVLRMRFVEGLGFRQMSEKTGTPLSTLQARVGAALKKIRKKIGKECEEA